MRKLTFLLILPVLFLVGCQRVEAVVPSPTVEEPTVTVVSPTATPEPTVIPTEVPTKVPTQIPTPTATPEPSAWDIVDQMFSECAALPRWGKSTWDRYELQLRDQMLAAHPEWDTRGYVRNYGIGRLFAQDGNEWSWIANTDTLEMRDYPNPFSFADLPDGSADTGLRPEDCAMYILVYEKVPENGDGDGVIVGEAYLFYEVGGQDPLIFDGELRELRFSMPPFEEQDGFRQLYDAVEGAVGKGCLRVATMPQYSDEAGLEAFNDWFGEYTTWVILEVVGEVPLRDRWLTFLAPENAQPQCVILLYRNPTGEVFLIYEIEGGFETVSLGTLAYDPFAALYPSDDQPVSTPSSQCQPPTGRWLNEEDPIRVYAEPDISSPVVEEIPLQDLESVGFGPEGPVCQAGYVWLPVWSEEELETVGWVWSEPYP
ncbi:hypothetical protein GTO10_03815 [Candidatus Saccharibacteria bacterium]|nr:hypothetical protein [Candidatus Saccharibacteria bacterium]